MIKGHQSMAKGVGEMAEQSEGLYLGCGTAAERDGQDEHHGRDVLDKKMR
jgi:hypothetical protein